MINAAEVTEGLTEQTRKGYSKDMEKTCENLEFGNYDCSDLYNCCDCGTPGGLQCCAYCFSCNACETCLANDD